MKPRPAVYAELRLILVGWQNLVTHRLMVHYEVVRKYDYLVFPAVDLKEGDGPFSVDFVSWRMSKIAFCLLTTKKGNSKKI